MIWVYGRHKKLDKGLHMVIYGPNRKSMMFMVKMLLILLLQMIQTTMISGVIVIVKEIVEFKQS
jgi:hypothetical protein